MLTQDAGEAAFFAVMSRKTIMAPGEAGYGCELGLAIEFDDSIFDAIEDGHQIVLLEELFIRDSSIHPFTSCWAVVFRLTPI